MKTFIHINNERLFMVRFLFQNNENHICNTEGLLTVLRDNDTGGGIESIKIFNYLKAKFERVSKKDIRNFCSYFTELDLYLENHYYFKK